MKNDLAAALLVKMKAVCVLPMTEMAYPHIVRKAMLTIRIPERKTAPRTFIKDVMIILMLMC